MEEILLFSWLLSSIFTFILGFIVKDFSWFFLALIGYGIVVLIISIIYDTGYDAFRKTPNEGDHYWYEWSYCKMKYNEVKRQYNPDTYVKMDFHAFEKYFTLNPDRYVMHPGHVDFKDHPRCRRLTILFPKKQLRKYFLFRRTYRQGKKLQDILPIIQEDIDKAIEEAQSYVNKAQQKSRKHLILKEDK